MLVKMKRWSKHLGCCSSD